jgi:hypothetical protein
MANFLSMFVAFRVLDNYGCCWKLLVRHWLDFQFLFSIRRFKMDLNKVIAMAFKSCCLFFLIVLIACQSSLSNSPATIAPEARISMIKGGPYEGSWQSSDVLLEYQYYKHPGEINLSVNGKAKRKFDELKVWALFLDGEGKILDRKLIYARGFRQESTIGRQYKRSFENSFEMPLEATYLAFRSYSRPYVGSGAGR